MGLSFAQTLGNAAQSFEDARAKNLAEQQAKQEMALRQGALAKTLQQEMLRTQIEQTRANWEQQRYLKELELSKQKEWQPLKEPMQGADGKWYLFERSTVTGATRITPLPGTPQAIVKQDMQGDQRNELQDKIGKQKLEQIAASGRWHTRWAQIAAQGRLNSQDYQRLRTDPGYIKATGEMRASLGARNRILSMMYSVTNPPTPEQMAELNKQLKQVDDQLEDSAKSAEQVRNRVIFGSQLPDTVSRLKNFVGAAGGKVRARDPQGKLHEAPAGTPLPPGWKLEQ